MNGPPKQRSWGCLVAFVTVFVLTLLIGLNPLAQGFIMLYGPPPLRWLPVYWSRVTVGYDIMVVFEAQPKHAVILLPAVVLDGCEIAPVTAKLQEQMAVTTVVTERGVFYRFTEESFNADCNHLAAYIRTRINERPKRLLFWDNHLVERFDLSGQGGPDGGWGYWVYIESDVPATQVSVRAYLYPAYQDAWDQPWVRISQPLSGWNWVEGEDTP